MASRWKTLPKHVLLVDHTSRCFRKNAGRQDISVLDIRFQLLHESTRHLQNSRYSVNMGELNTPSQTLNVAVVGGGIIGVMTALGLIRRGINVTIYERAAEFQEIGAGFGFTGIARECMQRIDPAILAALSKISQKSSSNGNTRYWDAFHARNKEDAEEEAKSLLFQIPDKHMAFWGAVRSHLLLAMAGLLPNGVINFGKQLVEYEDVSDSDRVVLHFSDGSVAEAHVLIGCDGIRSTTRKLLLGPDNLASRPAYSHVVAYRTMVPMNKGIEALGEDKAMSACMHCSPDVNMMSYPVRSPQQEYQKH